MQIPTWFMILLAVLVGTVLGTALGIFISYKKWWQQIILLFVSVMLVVAMYILMR